MTPEDFITKWRGVERSELAASHGHFNELCELLELKKPTDDDPTGQHFTFEKPVPGAGKGGGGGFADVWRKASFGNISARGSSIPWPRRLRRRVTMLIS